MTMVSDRVQWVRGIGTHGLRVEGDFDARATDQLRTLLAWADCGSIWKLKITLMQYRSNLRGACLMGADLRGSDLSGADLLWANFIGADMRGACLAGADLGIAGFSGADLRGVPIESARFHRAKLAGADRPSSA